jgi:arylsulfatase A-like enzyme
MSSQISKGSSTVEWLRANFDGRDLYDTVYVTANPQLERNRKMWDVQLHKTINVWLENGWDTKTGTVRAETLTEAALAAAEQFPHKRLVIHYMQPHYPFVPADADFDKEHLRQIGGESDEPSGENVWNQKFNGELEISREELWAMYTDNLEYVLKHVEELLATISGKVVITADHGNYVGERASPIPIREYGHPRGLYDEPVVRVPWFVYEEGTRREIRRTDPDAATNAVESGIIDDRLRDLGYK